MIINNLYLYIVIKDRFLMVRLFSHFWVKYYTLRHKPVYPKITLKSESLIRLIEHKICCLFLCSCLRLHCLPTIFFSQNFISLSESFIGLEYKKCCSSQCYMFVWKRWCQNKWNWTFYCPIQNLEKSSQLSSEMNAE